jgi:hypothetical protein
VYDVGARAKVGRWNVDLIWITSADNKRQREGNRFEDQRFDWDEGGGEEQLGP